MFKPKPWEIFCAVLKWKMTVDLASGRADGDGQWGQIAKAIRAAEREAAHHLRYDLQWSLVNSRLMAADFARSAEQWLRCDSGDTDQLRSRVRAVWCARWSIHLQEEQRRRTTADALEGVAGGRVPEKTCSPAEAGEHVFELYM